jgi:methyl-accepting chemotaxis protein
MNAHRVIQWLRHLWQPAPMFGLAVIGVFWVGLAYQLSVEHTKALDAAIERGDSFARLFEAATIRLIGSVDRTLLRLRQAYEENPDQFDLNRWASRAAVVSDVATEVGIVGPDGYLKGKTGYTGPPIYLGDREHFKFQVDSKTDELFIAKPLVLRTTGKSSIQMTRRLHKLDGGFAGVLVASIDPGFAENFARSFKLGEQSVVTVRGLDGVIRATHGFMALTTSENMPKLLSEALTRSTTGHYWGGVINDGINRLISYRVIAEYPLILVIGETESHVFEEYNAHRLIYVATAAILTLLTLIAVSVILRRQVLLKHTNNRFNAALENMTYGLCMFDADRRLVICNDQYAKLYRLGPELVNFGTPIRDIIASCVKNGVFADENSDDVLEEKLNEIGQRASNEASSLTIQLADGRLIRVARKPMKGGGWVAIHEDITESSSRDEQEKRRAEIDAAIKSFRESVDINLMSAKGGAADLKLIAEKLSTSSNAAARQATGAVQASDKATTNVGSAAIATVELSSSTFELTRQLEQAAKIARDAVNEALATNDEISGLKQAAEKIGNIVAFIQDIAEQTNLLALNATIEAARAGNAGRGFAVVASEVKSLAVQTAKATEEIAAQISSVQGSTGVAVEAIRKITERIKEIDQYAYAVSNVVGQQNVATGEISRHVEDAAQETKIASTNFEQVVSSIKETNDFASMVLTASMDAEAAATNLKEKVEDFLQKVAV